MAARKQKYWVHGSAPFENGHLVAVCRYSPEDVAKGTQKACSLKTLRTYYSPEKPEESKSLPSLPPHFVQVPKNITPDELARRISKAHELYGKRGP